MTALFFFAVVSCCGLPLWSPAVVSCCGVLLALSLALPGAVEPNLTSPDQLHRRPQKVVVEVVVIEVVVVVAEVVVVVVAVAWAAPALALALRSSSSSRPSSCPTHKTQAPAPFAASSERSVPLLFDLPCDNLNASAIAIASLQRTTTVVGFSH